MSRPRPSNPVFGVFAAAVALLVACGQGGAAPERPSPKGPTPLVVGKGDSAAGPARASGASSEEDLAIPIGREDAVRGRRDAYVTLVVFSDFECLFCARADKAFDRLAERFGPEELRIVFKNHPLPFHSFARFAAEVGQGVLATAGPEAFWRYDRLAFQNQGQRQNGREEILRWAKEAGANPRELEDGVERKRWAPKVDADVALGDKLGVKGTPTTYIDGIEVTGMREYEVFAGIVDAELARAKSLAGRGVSRDKVYAHLLEANLDTHAAAPEGPDEHQAAEARVIHKIPIKGSPARGSANALVTIVEFSDFQCPFCKRVEPTLDRVRNDYGDKVRIVWKDEPLSFHPYAEPAAELARAARAQKGDAGFWAMHDAIFDASPALTEGDLERLAKKQGLDAKKAMKAVSDKAFKDGIEEDAALASDFGATGTPTFFVNGRKLSGAQPYEQFKALIDEEVARAEGLVKSGVPKGKVYEAAIKDGVDAPEPEKKSIGAPRGAAPYRGSATAKLVIEEVGDFQDPFTKRVDPTIDALLKAYPGKVKVVWRDNPLPFHAHAALAAEAAREAYIQKGNDGFAKMRAQLLQNQSALERKDLDGYARKIGLDPRRFAKALDDRTHRAAVEADQKAAQSAGATATPAFFIGPYYVAGAQPLYRFKRLVDRAMAQPAPAPIAVAGSGSPATSSALVVKDVVVGKGAAAQPGDKLKVEYLGTLDDGTVFDGSKQHGRPFEFELGKGHVIKGWEHGLVGMKVGGKRRLTIGSDLAYGDKGVGSTIPPKATLHFDVELLAIEKP